MQEEHRDRVSGLEERIKSLQKSCESAARLEARCESAEAIAASLRDRLHAAERARTDAEATVSKLQEQLDNPSAEVAALRAKVRELGALSEERHMQLKEMARDAARFAPRGREVGSSARERRMEAALVSKKRELEGFRAELDEILSMAASLSDEQRAAVQQLAH